MEDDGAYAYGDDGETPASRAVTFLQTAGAYPTSSRFHQGVGYSTEGSVEGTDRAPTTFHLENFDLEDEEAVFAAMRWAWRNPASKAKAPKRNPKLGKHPDLYAPNVVGDYTDVVVEDWRVLTPDELRGAASRGEIADEDYAEMSDEGVDNVDELRELDEGSRERRAEPFINWVRIYMWGGLESEYGNKDTGEPIDENYVDMFQTDLEDASFSRLKKSAIEMSDLASNVFGEEDAEEGHLDEGDIDAILRDPGIYTVMRVDDEYRAVPGSVWAARCGVKEEHVDSFKHQGDHELEVVLHGGSYDHKSWGPAETAHERGEPTEGLVGRAVDETISYPGLTDDDLHYALKELSDDEPYVTITTWRGGRVSRRVGAEHLDSSRPAQRTKFAVSDLDEGFDMSSSFYESSYIHAIVNAERLDEAIQAKLEETGGKSKPQGKAGDDVVYEYAGTNDSIAGASARGMYVARLAPKDLRREGAALGTCIGTEANRHPQALRDGKTKVFSIRTEVGKSKFTIELQHAKAIPGIVYVDAAELDGSNWTVAEVKGKANRLPGFEAGKDVFTKPDDLRLVTDFLLSLGYAPAYLKTVRDIAPGIKAAEESGMDPFAPPPRKARKPRPETNPRTPASPAVRRLLARTRPMGLFR